MSVCVGSPEQIRDRQVRSCIYRDIQVMISPVNRFMQALFTLNSAVILLSKGAALYTSEHAFETV